MNFDNFVNNRVLKRFSSYEGYSPFKSLGKSLQAQWSAVGSVCLLNYRPVHSTALMTLSDTPVAVLRALAPCTGW